MNEIIISSGLKIIIIPGNGNTDVYKNNWYQWVKKELEKKGGYYNRPWQWETIKKNAGWIMQFASTDDPYIPIFEARFIHKKLNTEYYEYTNKDHFMIPEFPELVEIMKKKIFNN